MNRTSRRAAAAVVCAALVTALPARAGDAVSEDPDPEVLSYRWSIRGLQGALARVLFFPAGGEGVFTLGRERNGYLRCEFRATSEKADDDEHWTFGALVDPGAERTVHVWNSYRFRGKEKEKTYDLESEDVVDVVSGIHLLRRSPPDKPRRLTVWSDRKLYPVVVSPQGHAFVEVGGERVLSRRFSVRGVREPGRRRWNAEAEIALADGDSAVPVEILYRRAYGSLKLELAAPPAEPPSRPPGSQQ